MSDPGAARISGPPLEPVASHEEAAERKRLNDARLAALLADAQDDDE